MAKATKKLEDILVEAGIATTKDLERARRRMNERGGRLLGHIADKDGFDDVAFARALAKAFGLPLADGDALLRVAAPRTPSRRAALRALAIERVLLPIGATRQPRAVEVAMFDPTDTEAIERLRAICGGVKVKVHVAPRRELLEAIGQTYGRVAAGILGQATPVQPLDERDLLPAADEPAADRDDDDDEMTGVELEVRWTPRPTPTPLSPSPPDEERTTRTTAQEVKARAGRRDAPTPLPSTGVRDSRLTRVLFDAVALLAEIVEERLSSRVRHGRSLALLSRLVARELGISSTLVEEIGLAAHLFSVDRVLRDVGRVGGHPAPDLRTEFGWAVGSPEGLVQMLESLAVVADGLPAPWRQARPVAEVDAPLGAQIIAAVAEYLSLAEATAEQPDKHTLNQLLRVTTAPEIIEALERVIDAQRMKETTHVG